MTFNLLSTNEDIEDFITDVMLSNTPHFLGRVGGSDYNAVVDYFFNKDIINDSNWFDKKLYELKRYNGYFDFRNDSKNFIKYLDQMIDCYRSADSFSFCNADLSNQFYKNSFTRLNKKLIEEICRKKNIFSYDFIHDIRPFLNSFSKWGHTKKILVISPLSRSVLHQWNHRENLYLDYTFPECELYTYNTSITYSNASDSKEDLNLITDNWHEECERMATEISEIDFDVALLSCGSYSMFLGKYIKNSLQKKSIYIGGALNVLFNIYGNRFGQGTEHENIYKNAGCNVDYQIDPLENDMVDKIKSGRGKRSESLGAYFGSRDGRYIWKNKKG